MQNKYGCKKTMREFVNVLGLLKYILYLCNPDFNVYF